MNWQELKCNASAGMKTQDVISRLQRVIGDKYTFMVVPNGDDTQWAGVEIPREVALKYYRQRVAELKTQLATIEQKLGITEQQQGADGQQERPTDGITDNTTPSD